MQSPYYNADQINLLPNEPGVYKFINSSQELIYVGKAKNLKKRVSSYFNKSKGINRKTLKMVSEISKIEIALVNTEADALLLENSLIKKNQPKYNILLRDDKTYPYICITKERFPRVIVSRKVIKSQGTYYGPYPSSKAMRAVLDLIRHLYTVRTCTFNLSEENIRKGKFKVCLEFHIGNCQGPCEGLQNEEDYNNDIEHIRHIIKGHLGEVRSYFQQRMQDMADTLEFEKAQAFKEKLESLELYQAKSQVVNPAIASVDVFVIVSDDKMAFINYLKVIDGAINVAETIEVKKKLNEQDQDILSLFMVELRDKFASTSKEILTNIPLDTDFENIKLTVPQIGDKKKLVDLALKNAIYYKKERYSRIESKKELELRVLKQMKDDLQLPNLPLHIECFDNSNIQGTNPVASMVCFKNGRPSKKDYRKYNIKTVVGPNDFASMEEIVGRRYKRLKEEAQSLPNLIIVDGGKGQLSAACNALKSLGLYGQIPIIGIAKRLEEIYYPEDSYPLHIDKKSETLKLIQRLRDEAHRFAITFHRDKRSKASIQSELDTIGGIGPKTVDKLLKTFKSIKKIKEASLEDLSAVVGKDKAGKVKQSLS
ncbi:excinuclease ABC subunit UvrC [Xanthovirga aplysinae]|uniref:excinuclease ABC subunit UvrC n=1 Tax=Xanthovirga aplysinae TaxID=2529853 RepID=UPI0012BD229E|nr:excinuclease ABC subunit UvrC [Xanthovirga aplysinae]MTI33327.1 excinuclease ABC subunit C [Xanthovirga aplysinae]